MPCRSPGVGGVSRPTTRGKLRGLARGLSTPTPRGVSRPTPGGSLQAHTQGEVEGSGQWGFPHPHPGGGVFQHALRQTPPPPWTATAAGGTDPTGMHSCSQYFENLL